MLREYEAANEAALPKLSSKPDLPMLYRGPLTFKQFSSTTPTRTPQDEQIPAGGVEGHVSHLWFGSALSTILDLPGIVVHRNA
ncbi:hypothetical protein [Bradyrhizobium canariense]|uniref:hypothetical protein n=1 Tax=Bradyrhizobium canariense TaxID=255045 RepID=UPI00117826AE|nr:hypothetical protein [Bradyrhizobium canariense]